jgi:hypothetical protein
MAIDARNVLNTIPLGIRATIGNYNFKVQTNDLPKGTLVFLKDKYINNQVEIKVGENYPFNINSDTASKGEHRFELQIIGAKANATVEPMIEGFTAEVIGNITQGNTVNVKIMGSNGPVTIRSTDMAGRTLASTQVINGSQTVFVGNARAGMLVLQFSDGKTTITKKLIKF